MRQHPFAVVSLHRVLLVASNFLVAGAALLVLLWLLDGAPIPPTLAQTGTGIIRVAMIGNDTSGCGSAAVPCRTVQYAVDQAQAGDEVRVAMGVYTDVQARMGITQVLYISKTITVRGGYSTTDWTIPDPFVNLTTLDADGQGRVVYITGGTTPVLEGLLITGGDASGLGGRPDGYDAGGGVYVYLATAIISGCTVYSNTASANIGYGGGMYLWSSAATLLINTVQDNTAAPSGDGGGLYLSYSDATLRGNTVQGNIASTAGSGCGGGLYLQHSDATLQDNTVQSNTANTGSCCGGLGGGLYLQHSDATLLTNTIQSNIASSAYFGWGGGLYLSYSGATLQGNVVISNIASTANQGLGGGLFLEYGTAVLEDNTIQSNTASTAELGKGGGLYLSYNSATLKGNTVQSNTASIVSLGYGGGIFLDESPATLQSNTVQSNTASTAWVGLGGGLNLHRSAALLQSNIVIGNKATCNQAVTGQGGGLWVQESSSFTLTNNLVAANHATTGGSGLWVEGSVAYPSSGHLLHTTIADNGSMGLVTDQSSEQGVYVGSYTILAFTNTIFAGHAGVGITVTTGSTTALRATLWYSNGMDTGGGGTVLTGPINLNGDPNFVNPAAWNYHLAIGSLAVDAGDTDAVPADLTSDLDGNPRIVNGAVDLGAYEAAFIILSLHKSVTPDDKIPYHSAVTYTLKLDNSGTLSGTVTLTDILPVGVTFGKWVSQPVEAIHSGNAITWEGVISAGESVIAVFTITHTGSYGDIITNTAHLSATSQTGSAAAVFTVEDNAAPFFTSTPILSATENVPYTVTVTADDANLVHGDALIITALTLPDWLTFTDHGDGTATLAGVPASADVGIHAVELCVTDRGGESDSLAFAITVTEKPQCLIRLPLVVRNVSAQQFR